MTLLSEWINISSYYCIASSIKKDGTTTKAFHVPSTKPWLNFLSNFGQEGFNAWDLNKDGIVNTLDLQDASKGLYTSPSISPEALPTDLLKLDQTYGEGNSFFYPLYKGRS